MLSRLFIAALLLPVGKELTSWLLFVMSNCDFVTFPCDMLGQVGYLIVLNPDLCRLSYFKSATVIFALCDNMNCNSKALFKIAHHMH